MGRTAIEKSAKNRDSEQFPDLQELLFPRILTNQASRVLIKLRMPGT
jgi:hypothetical protein